MASSARDVFINCPFDDAFTTSFQALVFAVLACGFRARCAREMDDAAETRIDKLYRIIEESRYSIHDLSRTENPILLTSCRGSMISWMLFQTLQRRAAWTLPNCASPIMSG